MDPAVMAHPKWSGIDEGNTGTLAGGSGFQVNSQRYNHLTAQLGKPVVGNQPREQLPELFEHIIGVEFFEGADPGQVEQDLDGHDLNKAGRV